MTSTRTAPARDALRRYRWVALYLPVGAAVVIAAIQATVIDDLTATVGTHFRLDGTADGWGPAWTYPAMMLGVGGGTSALLAGLCLLGYKGIGTSGKPARLRTMAGISLGGAVFLLMTMGILATPSVGIGANVLVVEGLAVIPAVLLGWLAYRFTFDVPSEGGEPTQPAPVALAVDERAVWTRKTSMGKVGLWINIGATVLMVACLALAAWAEISEDGRIGWVTWLMLILTLAMAGGLPAFTSALVRVDAGGFSVRSTMGWPKIRIPLEQIDKVEIVDVNPMGDFGGWGWRQGLGSGKGVVFRTGEGLRITRTNGKLLTVTVDDAATAVALLEGLRSRA